MALRREMIEERLKELDLIRGLGGFRNVLIHRYLSIDPGEVLHHYRKGLRVFPRFAAEVLAWLDAWEAR